MWKGPTKLIMKWPHLSYSIQNKLKSVNIINKPMKQPNNIVMISKRGICQLHNFGMLEVLEKRFWHTRIRTMPTNFARATESSVCPFYSCKPLTFQCTKDVAWGMRLLTKQRSFFFFVNLIFEVHNLLPKLYKPTTCETSFHIKRTNFQAPMIKRKSHWAWALAHLLLLLSHVLQYWILLH